MLLIEKKEEGLNPRQIRQKENIPVTIYGKSLKQALSMQVSLKNFKKARSSRFVQCLKGTIEGEKGESLFLIKSIESNPVTDEVLNIQLQKVTPDEFVNVIVPIIYVGTSPTVQAGGTLFINKRTIELKCPAGKVPASIEFDLDFLKDNVHTAYYKDLNLAEGLKLRDPGQTLQIIAKTSAAQVAES